MNGDIVTLHEEISEEESFIRADDIELDFTPEDFISEEGVKKILQDEGDGGPLLASFIKPDILDDFNNLVTSIAKQLSRILRTLPASASAELVVRQHLFFI